MTTTLNASTAGAGGFIATSDNSGSLALQTAGTTAVTIDTSQNVGIGTSSIANIDATGKTLEVYGGAGGGFIHMTNSTTGQTVSDGFIIGTQIGGSDALLVQRESANMIFRTADTERMRIDSSGNLLVGTTTSDSYCRFSTQGAVGARWGFGPSLTGSDLFRVQNSNTTGVYLTSGNTSWTSNSDERKKDIIEPITNGLQKVSTLRAVIGKYKIDEEGTRRSFLIAQDVQAVLPEAVDATDPDNLGVQYTEVIPLLVKAIQELKAINDTQAETINALTARIVALETA
jgi:hypothetical protein